MELKKCGGYYGKCYHSDDMMVPIISFSKTVTSRDGLAGSCKMCNIEQHKKADPRSNAVSREAYRIAGGIKPFYSLPVDDRAALRAVVRGGEGAVKTTVVKYITSKLPTIKRGAPAAQPMQTRTTVAVEGERVPEGWVYAIRNAETPRILKIGKTYPNGMEGRIAEARRWGRAEVVAKCWAADALEAEAYIHEVLVADNMRSLGYEDVGKELFKCSANDFQAAFGLYLQQLQEAS